MCGEGGQQMCVCRWEGGGGGETMIGWNNIPPTPKHKQLSHNSEELQWQMIVLCLIVWTLECVKYQWVYSGKSTPK